MRIRNQKMATLLLVGCISLSGMPLHTFARSINNFNKTISVVQGTAITAESGLTFDMNFKAGELKDGTVYFIEGKDFEFDYRAYRNTIELDGAKVIYTDNNKLKVVVYKTSKDATISIPVYGTVKEGNPRLVVDGTDSVATSGEYTLTANGTVERYGLTITGGEVPNISTMGDGSLADLIIEENAAKTLISGTTIRLKLPTNTNLAFRLPSTDSKGYATSLQVEGLRGLAGQNIKVKAEYIRGNKQELLLTLEGISPASVKGGVKIKGLECEPVDRNKSVTYGEVPVTIRMDEGKTTTLTMGQVSNEGLNLKVTKPISLIAGKESQKVEVTLSENVAGSLSRRHDVELEVKGANIVPGTLQVVGASLVTIKEDIDTKTKEVTSFTVDTRKIDPNVITKLTFTFEVFAEADDLGEVTLVADAYKFEEKAVLGQVKSAYNIKMNQIALKTALKDQIGGKMEIIESAPGLFKSGDQIIISVERAGDGINFTDVKVEGEDIRLGKIQIEDGKIILNIERGSDEQAIIRLSDFEITVDGLVDEGTYDVNISGSAISKDKYSKLTLKDVLKVGSKQAETSKPGELQKGTAYFKVGESTYTVNEEEKEMDAAPYLAPSGRVMVPVKYVSDAFGIGEDKLYFGKEEGRTVIVVEAGSRILKLTDGSDLAEINGVVKPMDEKVTIIGGRTYVPVGEMARMLDIDVEWIGSSKIAIFTNK